MPKMKYNLMMRIFRGVTDWSRDVEPVSEAVSVPLSLATVIRCRQSLCLYFPSFPSQLSISLSTIPASIPGWLRKGL